MKRFFPTAFYRYLTLNFCLIIFAVNTTGQTSVIDSLERELKRSSIEDTNLVNTLNSLAFSYYTIDIDKTIELVKKSHKIANTLKYTSGKARAIFIRGIAFTVQSDYNKAIVNFDSARNLYASIADSSGLSATYNALGIVNYYKGDLESSIQWYKKSIDIEKKIGNEDVKSQYLNIGSSYGELGVYDEAIKYYKKALHINISNKDSAGISSCYNNIGTLYDDQGNFPLALQYYTKSLGIDEKLRDSVELIKDFNNIGIVYKKRLNYEKALEYYEKSLTISQNIDDKKAINQTIMNIGIIHINQQKFEKAIPLLKEALASSKKIEDNRLVSSCLNNLGDTYYALKKYDLALFYYNQAKDVSEELGFQLSLCNSLLGIATVYNQQGKLVESLKYALESKKISINLDLLTYQRDVNKLLAEIYEKKNNFRDALVHHEQYKLLSDSIFNKEKIEKIAQIEYDFKFQKELEVFNTKERKLTKKVELTNKDLEKSESRFLIGVVIFLIILLIAAILIFQLRLRHIKSQNENSLLEQKLLRSQMTPHFIFNSLSVLQGMILNKEDQKASLYLSKFSKLLRVTLESSREKMTPLSQEIIALENYVAIQNIESNQSFTFTIRVADTIHPENVLIPPMLIQPFVENAIEHAFTPDHRDKNIEVVFSFPDNQLVCTITDNGIGVQEKINRSGNSKKSLATSISKERIQLLARELRTEGSIQIIDRKSNNETGTLVTLVIPYKLSEQ